MCPQSRQLESGVALMSRRGARLGTWVSGSPPTLGCFRWAAGPRKCSSGRVRIRYDTGPPRCVLFTRNPRGILEGGLEKNLWKRRWRFRIFGSATSLLPPCFGASRTDAPSEVNLGASCKAENLVGLIDWSGASPLGWMQLACVGKGICPPYKALGLLLCKLKAPDGCCRTANGG